MSERIAHHVAQWDEVTVFTIALVLLQFGAVVLGWIIRGSWDGARRRGREEKR